MSMRTTPSNPYNLDKKSEASQAFYRTVSKMPFIPSARSYNLTISHQRKFMWFRVAKAGTRTILNHLTESNVQLDVGHASRLHYPVNSYSDYFKFAFVRNPWDRLVSCWLNKVVNGNYFKFNDSEHVKMKELVNFVNYVSELDINKCDRHLRSQSELIDLNMVNYIGRMETFEDDANYIFRKLKIPEKKIVPKNVTPGRVAYQDYYSGKIADKVAEIYQKDVKIFGHKFE